MEDELLTTDDLVRILKVHRASIRNFRNRKVNPLPMINLSNNTTAPTWRISREALDNWLAQGPAANQKHPQHA